MFLPASFAWRFASLAARRASLGSRQDQPVQNAVPAQDARARGRVPISRRRMTLMRFAYYPGCSARSTCAELNEATHNSGYAQLFIQLASFLLCGAMQFVKFFFVIRHKSPKHSTSIRPSGFEERNCTVPYGRATARFTFGYFLLTFALCANAQPAENRLSIRPMRGGHSVLSVAN